MLSERARPNDRPKRVSGESRFQGGKELAQRFVTGVAPDRRSARDLAARSMRGGIPLDRDGRRGSPMAMSTTETTGTRDVTYDLISVVYHALQGAETYQMYEQDAKQSGDREAESLFHEAHQANRQFADRAKSLLGQRMSQGSQSGSG